MYYFCYSGGLFVICGGLLGGFAVWSAAVFGSFRCLGRLTATESCFNPHSTKGVIFDRPNAFAV